MLRHLKQSRRAHPTTDAHGDDDVLDAAALAFDQGMTHQGRTRRAVRMTLRSSAPVEFRFKAIVRLPKTQQCLVKPMPGSILNCQARQSR